MSPTPSPTPPPPPPPDTVAGRARELPREPTAAWIRGLVAVAAALWAGVFVWMVGTLPDQVPVQFEFSGSPTRWSSRAEALGVAVWTTAVLVLPAVLVPWLLFRSPAAISAPNRRWWTATPARFRRFERLLREDLLLLAAVGLALIAVAQGGITVAATSPDGEMPPGLMPVMLLPLAGLVLVAARMTGAGGRYSERPGVE